MSRPVLWLLAMSMAGAFGCHTSPVSPTEVTDLLAAERKWASKGFSDYSVVVAVSCGECPDVYRQAIRIDVRDGKVVRATGVASGEDVSADFVGQQPPVEAQFAWIRRANESAELEDLLIGFDAEFGFPAYVSSRYDPSVMDAGGATYLSHLQQLIP